MPNRLRLLGIVLVVVGILALLYGGIGWNRERTVIDVGPFKATATERTGFPLSPLLGAIALIGGVVLLVDRKKLLG